MAVFEDWKASMARFLHIHFSLTAMVLASSIAIGTARLAPANGLDALSDAQSLFIDCSMFHRENRTMDENLMLLACRSVLHRAAMAQNWGPLAYRKSTFGWSFLLCPSRYHDFDRNRLPEKFVEYWLKQGVGELQWISPSDAAFEAVLGKYPECYWTSNA